MSSGKVLFDPGLVPNAPDGMSCMHACVQMVMRTKPDGIVFSFDEINKILRRKEGYYSWGYAIWAAVSRQGFEIKSYGTFSTERFVKEKEEYLLERYGEEAGRVQIAHTDMPVVLEDAEKFLRSKSIVRNEVVPTIKDIKTALDEGWYVVPVINARIINNKEGYSGHFIFIYGYNEEHVIFHDPGKPTYAQRIVSWELFEKAWSSPRQETRSMTCLRSSSKGR